MSQGSAQPSSAGKGSRPAARRNPYALIRPRRGRVVAYVAAVVVFATFLLGAIIVPGQEGQKDDWAISDRLLIAAIGAAIAWFLWRLGSIRATPSKQGLVVRNLLLTRTLAWDEIVRMQFGGGAPWASLDLADTDTVAVMALQKADGEYGRAEAARLAALIQHHGDATEPQRRS
ncbi:PH domain-containing protein [Gephyromycinifex aptenodytis]|uniref:PH domain-containing protein n=1 Tax=Gephyromycinifex aptenodytis TaxID=2716227 RepID=UPI00144852D6|nr:PH domain-containing protein [Gephyromycinifex aptenodytis]